MKSKLSLGKVFGIRIQVHWTFLFIIAWVIYVGWRQGANNQAIVWSVIYVLSIFACVVLHELGHALTAKQFGISTSRITLLPIGGVASLERMPEKPKQELLVAVMGPLVNVVIAGILFLFVYQQLAILQQPEKVETFFRTVTSENYLMYLFFTNIALVVFNLIPAFPMDGGRVLRALLSFRMDRVRATQIAANLGQIIAFAFLYIGFVYNPILIFISVFVFLGASGENIMVKQMNVLKGHLVREAMITNYTVFHPQDPLDYVGKVLISGTERQFVVLQSESEIAGLLFKENIAKAFQSAHSGLTVSDILDKDFHVVQAEEDLSEIYRIAQVHRHHFFPVMENRKLVGVIDMENINEFIMLQSRLVH